MARIKSFLFVSYLKNKGVRRLCFIIGCILVILLIVTTPKYYNSVRIDEEYLNINDIKRWTDVFRDLDITSHLELVKCTGEYFDDRGMRNAQYSLYGDDPVEWYCSVQDEQSCKKFQLYANDKIKLDCGKKEIFIYRPLMALLFFYLPFILAIILKFLWEILFWVYKGFKESRKVN
jgi:hypothetical protein